MIRKSQNKPKKKPRAIRIIKGGVDKLTYLPDAFFYRIISLLELEDLACAVTLSKTFRKRCFFDPILEIDLESHVEKEELIIVQEKEAVHEKQHLFNYNYYGYDDDDDDDDEDGYRPLPKKKKEKCQPPKKNVYDEEERKQFIMKVLDKTMMLRNKDMKHIKISWHRFKPNDIVHVNKWIETAAKCNARKIDLDFSLEKEDDMIEIPPFGVLMDLESNLHDGILKFSSRLSFLTLKSVRVVCEDFGAMISSCKCLKKMSLKNCLGLAKIDINSTSLEEISIMKTNDDDLKHVKILGNVLETISIVWCFRFLDEKSIHLSTPSVKRLTWKGDSVNDCDLGSFISLKEASINLRYPSMLIENQTSFTDEFLIDERLIDSIKSVRGAKSLEINCWHIEGFVNRNRQPTSLNEIQELVLNVDEVKKDYQVPAILRFLNLLPNLQNLKVKNCRQPWGFAANLGKTLISAPPSCEWTSHLKSAEIELTGGGDEIELIGYLFKNAKELKKMIIFYSLLDDYRLPELSKKIKMLRFPGVVSFVPFT